MELAEKTIIAGIDITDCAKARTGKPYPLSSQFMDALFKEDKNVEDLKNLKTFLLEHSAELKDVVPLVQESSGDNVKDMASAIDRQIYNMKHNLNVV